jgi:hypothetical protein
VFQPQFLQNPSRPRRSLSRSGRPPPRTRRTVRAPTRWLGRADRVLHAIVLAPTPWRLGRRLSPRSPSSQTPARRRFRPRTAAPPDPSAAPGGSRYVTRLFQPTHTTLFTELPVSGVLRSWTSALRSFANFGFWGFSEVSQEFIGNSSPCTKVPQSRTVHPRLATKKTDHPD